MAEVKARDANLSGMVLTQIKLLSHNHPTSNVTNKNPSKIPTRINLHNLHLRICI